MAFCHDTFQHTGPNGIHEVIVSDHLISITAICESFLINALDDQDMIRQILTGLSYVHEQGVVHRGE